MPHPLLNQPAPIVSIQDASGDSFTIAPGKSGKPLVVFFYPASGTYGCTREACQFRDAINSNDRFKRTGVQVIGISGDAPGKQKKFVNEHNLGYPVLSDGANEARKQYHVPKGIFGLTEGRVTFCINKDGIVEEVHDSVLNFSMHATAVDKWLEKIGASEPTPTTTAATPAPAPTTTAAAEPAAPAPEESKPATA
ncbi:peroxiredoxin Q [Auriculariales sp. MPI-PUGE-AT-0066]|nr:peroxiredoxin Q [Auriculariales sp. MPI-PUGE-AT-0066]